jgi:hypothetical protein
MQPSNRLGGVGKRVASLIAVLAGIGKFAYSDPIKYHQNDLPVDQEYTFFSLHLHT